MRSSTPLLALLLLVGCGEAWQAAPTLVRSHAVDEKTEAYFAGPWPDDRRLVDGVLSTKRFPRPGNGSLQLNIFTTGDRVMKGWGMTSPIYVPFTGPIDPSSLPPLEGSHEPASSAYLIAVAPASAHDYGLRHPVDFHFFAAPTLYLPGNVLAVRPFPGSPLEPSTTYALVVTTRVRDANGAAVGPEESLWKVLHGKAQDATYAPLLALLDARQKAEVAGAFLFTTQPLMDDDLLPLRDWLEARPDPALAGARLNATRAGLYVFEGTYPAPNMQHGAVPYSLTGGDFQFDASGTPVPGPVEDMRVSFCVPKGPVPAGGFPVVVYSHGTGGNYLSLVDDICDDLAAVGVAAAGIDQVFHGPRGMGATGCFGQDIEVCFFNPVNVVAGRNNIRQAALDNVTLRKLLAHVSLPASLDPEGRVVTFAGDQVGFFGHSQGGLTGAVYVAFATHLRAALLSGAGGHLTSTLLLRKDPIDIKALAEGPLILGIEGQESLDPYHPALALIQAFADKADPADYAKHWVQRPLGAPRHLYVTSGMLDPYTPAFTAEVMAAAAGLPQEAPAAETSQPHAVVGLSPASPPYELNLAADDGRRVTGIFRQFPGAGHFPVFYDSTARHQWVAFFQSALKTDRVVIPAP